MDKVADKFDIVTGHDLFIWFGVSNDSIASPQLLTIFSLASAVPSGQVRETLMSAVRR